MDSNGNRTHMGPVLTLPANGVTGQGLSLPGGNPNFVDLNLADSCVRFYATTCATASYMPRSSKRGQLLSVNNL